MPRWFFRVVWLLLHSAVGAAQDRMDEPVVSVEDADVEAATIVDLDASGVVQSTLLVEGRQMRRRRQLPVVSKTERASFFCEPCEREKDGDHGAEIMPKDLSRAVPRLTIW